MDMNAKYKDIATLDTIYSGIVEQQIEMDYLLADYCPNIYKIIKCTVKPVVVSKRIANEKLVVDLNVLIKILYVTENNKKIFCVEQKQMYTKEIDIPNIDNSAIVSLTAKCEHSNLRVVNPRRLDLKGAITMKVVVTKPVQTKIIDKAVADNCYVKTTNHMICNENLYATKDATINEEIELVQGKPPISNILSSTANIVVSDCKVMKNKLLAKGNMNVRILYTAEQADENENNVLEYVIPFSQIIDMNGLDDEYKLFVNACTTEIDIDFSKVTPENKTMNMTLATTFDCYGAKNVQVDMLEDIYSTDYECDITRQTINPSVFVECVDYSFVSKNNLQIPNVTISGICDIFSEVSLPTSKITMESMIVMFNQNIGVIAYDETGMPIQFEKSVPCEVAIPNNAGSEMVSFNPIVTVIGCSYTLLSENQIEIRTEINIGGIVYIQTQCLPIVQSTLDMARPKSNPDNGAVCLYYAARGENVWDIAKHFNTSTDAIINENGMVSAADGNTIESRQMILIPLKR